VADGRRWHHFPGQRTLGGDHDERSIAGPDREGSGVSPFKNAQHVGDLVTVIWPWPAPADHDPVTDISRSEPDLETVAHPGYLFLDAAPSLSWT